MKKTLSILLTALAMLAMAVGCGKPEPAEKVEPVVATITASDVTVEEGKTVQITAATNSSAAISYSSADAAVATVSNAGLVTGVKAGNTTVTLSVAAVEDKFTAAEKTISVTVTAPETPPTPPELQALTLKANVEGDGIFADNPSYIMHVTNPNSVEVEARIQSRVSTDFKKEVARVDFMEKIPANSTKDIVITPEADSWEPGFYKVNCYVDGKSRVGIAFGIRPFEIVSAPDMQPDFEEFWTLAYEQLTKVDMNVSFVPTKKAGTWMVSMQSIPDGLEGDPMVIRCYYIEPANDGKKHPAIVHYYGYDDFPGTTKLDLPSGSSDYAHLWVSARGQRINARAASLRSDGIEEDFVNPYSKQWFTVNFGDKDSYYYRGAYMDCVQGIRFLALCEDEKVAGRIDMDNVFVEGMSQGGAFSYAAAALSMEYPVRAIAPGVAFMGDFPDYFVIAASDGGGFPSMAQQCKQALKWDDAQMYAFMSYFDTKNLATRISCPIYANIGLLDNICPPHTNIAPYNNALTPSADKQMTFYPKMGHEVPSGWDSKYKSFFQSHMK